MNTVTVPQPLLKAYLLEVAEIAFIGEPYDGPQHDMQVQLFAELVDSGRYMPAYGYTMTELLGVSVANHVRDIKVSTESVIELPNGKLIAGNMIDEIFPALIRKFEDMMASKIEHERAKLVPHTNVLTSAVPMRRRLDANSFIADQEPVLQPAMRAPDIAWPEAAEAEPARRVRVRARYERAV